MCSYTSDRSMIQLTGSSNKGHGICCKPGSTNSNCVASDTLACSQPSNVANTIPKYKPILTSDTTNNQMFAFCPKTNAKSCGIKNSDDTTN